MYLLEVYVTNASLNINRSFTYFSDEFVKRFVRVKVKFAKADNMAIVYSVKETDRTLKEIESELGYKISKITEVIDQEPVISRELFDLAFWLSKTTVSPLISCLNIMLPKALKTIKNKIDPKVTKRIIKHESIEQLTVKQKQILDQLKDFDTYSYALSLSNSITHKLIDKGYLEIIETENEYKDNDLISDNFKQLTADQDKAYKTILNSNKTVSLLYGITGSGKTEVYLHLAREYLKKGKEVLILVPEISLTPQMIARVKQRFNDVIFYHSELSDQERYEQYKRVKKGDIKIVVGTRSAIFLPFSNLGMIIIDEEHDSSYKQDSTPCYHAKNVAIKRAIDNNAKVLLASATPSLDSYTRALKNDYEFVKLTKRINLKLPEIELIDLNREMRKKSSYIITNKLKDELINTINNNKQAIILLNRRGYSPIVKCGNCSTTLMCKDCDIPLNYHNDDNILKCHQCGRIYKVPKFCPNCNEDSLVYYGFGTKKVEEEIKKLIPYAKVERMDRDNVSKKGAHKNILDRFERKDINILIGTQMISKGLDFPDVTLVGILNADSGLMHSDYNSAKLTFDLLMQASGRSGRSDYPGKVYLQVFNTEHYAVKAVLNQDFEYFYNIEMNYRNKAFYPPYSHIIEIILSDSNDIRLDKSLNIISELLADISYKKYMPYEMNKIRKERRFRILLLDKDLIGLLNTTHVLVERYLKPGNLSKIKVDVDPLYME